MNTLLNAILLYSRIPVPFRVKCSDEALSRAIMFFPLIGAIVGTIGWGAYWVANYLFGVPSISVVVAIFAMTLSTGALHEDGFADFCDGFGGGYGKEAILRIMKDSFIGCYGVMGLIGIFLLRYTMLSSIAGSNANMLLVFIAAQSASRFGSVAMIGSSSYAREENSRSAHSALGVSFWRIVVAFCFGFATSFIALGWQFTALYFCVATIAFLLFRWYTNRHIGGFTGDTLGALQVTSELLFYATLLQKII
ncbi:MAG: adenosylcobinamide-GDP ribazoletransferase [Rikenellaceae bacterium]